MAPWGWYDNFIALITFGTKTNIMLISNNPSTPNLNIENLFFLSQEYFNHFAGQQTIYGWEWEYQHEGRYLRIRAYILLKWENPKPEGRFLTITLSYLHCKSPLAHVFLSLLYSKDLHMLSSHCHPTQFTSRAGNEEK